MRIKSTFSIFSILLLTTPIAVSALVFKTTAVHAGETDIAISQPTQITSQLLKKSEANRTSAATLAPLAPATPDTDFNYTAQQIQDTSSTLAQVTSVSQLSDVQPTDWAFQALQSLVERYGVIAGYPDGTFRGNRAMTRYEFAAGLNAAMDRINELITAGSADVVSKEDLETLNRLQSEFSSELATLRGRVDALEAQAAELEANQFSTTTVLGGEVIFGVASAFGGDPPGGCSLLPDNIPPFSDRNNNDEVDCIDRRDPDKNTVLAHLIRLGLETSFTGKDRLRTYLVTGNFDGGGFTSAESLNTYMARLSYQAGLENDVILDLLEYRFPAFNDRVVFSVIPFGFSLSNVLSANSAYFDTGRGSISRFGEASPIFKLGGVLDAGAGFDWLFAKNARLQIAYGTGGSNNPDSGVFGADRSALGVQLLATPTNNLITGLTYVNAYTNDGTLGTFTGSVNAETNGLWSDSSIPPVGRNILDPNRPSGFDPCCGVYLGNAPAKTNAVGVTLQWRVAQNLTFGAWGGYMFTNFLEELPDDERFRQPVPIGIGASAGKKPFANAATYLFSMGLSDPFGREGDLFAFLFGMPPKLVDAGPETPGTPVPFFETSRRGESEVPVTDNNRNLDTVGIERNRTTDPLPRRVGVKDEATSLHFEMFYRFRVSDNLFVTPGVVLVTNPGHIEDNNDIWLATIRTTFRF
ncbi:S-layer protein [Chroococcidiopsis sp. CCALA 051]|uniref:iron uptake porin n=1 Tax=Chroococcidiopsis sp. CCALA 051 TaxID=869949 RepID=UPI000D0E2D68|nr:iron uptake porin [Chroococcidiopsis sp. CCALA 051]PSM46125.1 S-layer protein [Chroococcidiopsis sp. CCALA 051]